MIGGVTMWQEMEKLAQKLQEQMEHFKQNLRKARFTGQSQDGKVMIVSNGLEEIVSVHLYVENMDEELKNNLEISIEEAINATLTKVRQSIQQKANEITGGYEFDLFK